MTRFDQFFLWKCGRWLLLFSHMRTKLSYEEALPRPASSYVLLYVKCSADTACRMGMLQCGCAYDFLKYAAKWPSPILPLFFQMKINDRFDF